MATIAITVPVGCRRCHVIIIFANKAAQGGEDGIFHNRAQPRRPASTATLYADGPARDWRIENSAESKAVLAVAPAVAGGSQLTMRYGLGGALSSAPYVALVAPAGESLRSHDRLTFVARADRPTRVSVTQVTRVKSWNRRRQFRRAPRAVHSRRVRRVHRARQSEAVQAKSQPARRRATARVPRLRLGRNRVCTATSPPSSRSRTFR